MPVSCTQSVLAQTIATMTAGSFQKLAAPTFTDALLDATQGHHIFEYAYKGLWDPTRCRAWFWGGGHLSHMRLIGYDATVDRWSAPPNAPWWCDPSQVANPYQCSSHGYGGETLDEQRGVLYLRTFNSSTLHRYDVVDGGWSTGPSLPQSPASCIATTLEYSAARDRLYYVDCTEQAMWSLQPGATAWVKEAAGPFAMGPYHDYGAYVPQQGAVYFGLGNGSTSLWKLDADGGVTAAPTPPREFHPEPSSSMTFRILTVDPVSGDLLAVAHAGSVFRMPAGGGAWAQTSATVPRKLDVAIPLWGMGAVLFLASNPAETWLYRP